MGNLLEHIDKMVEKIIAGGIKLARKTHPQKGMNIHASQKSKTLLKSI